MFASLVALAMSAACAGSYDPTYLTHAEPWLTTGAVSTLGVGDEFALTVFREEELSAQFVVPDSGRIRYPFIGDVMVLNQSCDQIADEVTARLENGYLRDPTVTCSVVEVRSNRINVVGEIASSGTYPFSPNMTIVDVIAGAGGLTPNAAPDRVVVTRVVDGEIIEIIVPAGTIIAGRAPNFPLWPDDTVFVPQYRLIP